MTTIPIAAARLRLPVRRWSTSTWFILPSSVLCLAGLLALCGAAVCVNPATAFANSLPALPDHLQEMMEYWAPVIFQDMCRECDNALGGVSDYIRRVDFDGDFDASNNWDGAGGGDRRPYVYGYATETTTHVFLSYALFYPRDHQTGIVKSDPNWLTEHENDLEGAIVLVRKDEGMGTLLAMATEAHGAIYYFKSTALGGSQEIDLENRDLSGPSNSKLWLTDDAAYTDHARPVVFSESGGHGLGGYGRAMKDWDQSGNPFTFIGAGETYAFEGNDGIVFYPSPGNPIEPSPPDGALRAGGYEILSLDEFWSRRYESGEATLFTGRLHYQGERGVVQSLLASEFRVASGHDTDGRANPPWVFRSQGAAPLSLDQRAKGDLLLDPARAFSVDISNLLSGDQRSYLFNPLLMGNNGFVITRPATDTRIRWDEPARITWLAQEATATPPTEGSDDTVPTTVYAEIFDPGASDWRELQSAVSFTAGQLIWSPMVEFSPLDLPLDTRLRFQILDPGGTFPIHSVSTPWCRVVADDTPVLLANFSLRAIGDVVQVAWRTARESSVAEFLLHARRGAVEWDVPVTPTGEGSFTALDESANLAPGGTVAYTLYYREGSGSAARDTSRDEGEGWLLLREEAITLRHDPRVARLLPPSPNPFNPATILGLEITEPAWVELAVYDVAGRLVRRLLDERVEAGLREVPWDGKDHAGGPVASGVYIARVTAGGRQDAVRLVLLR